jgi:alkanesulfonate monooxygenase SsuD/methylene tetrahydromethanopterin reductase-like flavin-dependent oxidoreductase (luciferase family)
LDHVSDGRFTFGVGAGAYGWDATMLGQAALSGRDRTDRFAEFVELMDRLLRNPETSFDGRFYVADGARTIPGCVQQPRIPFAGAATGTRGMSLAVRLAETWVTTGEGGPGRASLHR